MALRRHLTLYLGSRIVAAASNMLAVAIFTRLAGAEAYGLYVVMLATAMVVNGFAVQGICYAFFNHYRSDNDTNLIASWVTLLAASVALVVPIAVLALIIDHKSADLITGALMIAGATAVFDVTGAFARTRLDATRRMHRYDLRGVLVLAFGALALWTWKGALPLAIGIAAANLLAAVPAAVSLLRLIKGRPNWLATKELLRFGWPLILSFGVGAVSHSIDRFVLMGADGAVALAGYGALSDFVRAVFLVVGEGIGLGTIYLAKQQFNAGDVTAAQRTLGIAFRLFLVLGTFGVAGFMVFGPQVLNIMFPPDFIPLSPGLLLIVTTAAFALVLRNLYFAQVIYFSSPSYLELLSVCLTLVVNGGLCFLLIPSYGITGAAIGFLCGQIVSGLFFVVAARRNPVLPVPLRPILGMAVVGVTLVGTSWIIEAAGVSVVEALLAKTALFATLFAVAAYGFGLHDLVAKWMLPRVGRAEAGVHRAG